MIAFYDHDYKLLATATVEDGKLVTTGDKNVLGRLAEQMEPELYIEKFKNFNNGYIQVMEIPEGQEAPPELAVVKKQFPGYQV
jgi:hypothetical protein